MEAVWPAAGMVPHPFVALQYASPAAGNATSTTAALAISANIRAKDTTHTNVFMASCCLDSAPRVKQFFRSKDASSTSTEVPFSWGDPFEDIGALAKEAQPRDTYTTLRCFYPAALTPAVY